MWVLLDVWINFVFIFILIWLFKILINIKFLKKWLRCYIVFFFKFESKMGVRGGIIKFKFDLLVKID